MQYMQTLFYSTIKCITRASILTEVYPLAMYSYTLCHFTLHENPFMCFNIVIDITS